MCSLVMFCLVGYYWLFVYWFDYLFGLLVNGCVVVFWLICVDGIWMVCVVYWFWWFWCSLGVWWKVVVMVLVECCYVGWGWRLLGCLVWYSLCVRLVWIVWLVVFVFGWFFLGVRLVDVYLGCVWILLWWVFWVRCWWYLLVS